MKKILATLLIAIGAFGALAFAASSAEAQRRGAHRHHGHHHHHGARLGLYFGAPLLFSPWYYSRPYYDPYYYGRVVVRDQPVVYVEQQPGDVAPAPAPQAQAQTQQQFWYFCQDTQTYYPHVQNCATPWQRVIPHAPR